ncbi:MAG TPA: aldo/keto reductase [Candidatus Hydrogenedentes bacterium]|nr:aldo/keto reductase [Candidatus Hydrogenedentota bacterium]
MECRQLGQSRLRIPVVSFGAWAIGGWMWGGTDDKDALRALQRGIDLGVTCIDTAPVYGYGHSEEIVGQAIKGKRAQVIVATKCGLRWDTEEGEYFFPSIDSGGKPNKIFKNLKPASIKHECEQSLKRLGVDVIDLYQCHWPDASTPLEDTMEILLALKQEGKVRAIGVSNFTVTMMERCLESGTIASSQPKYNALEREAELEIIPFCREHTIGVLAYSPIAQGLLTGKVTVDREFPEGDVRRNKPLFSRENRLNVLKMLERIQPIAEAHEATLGQIFIAWLVAQPGMTSALVGARNEKQIEENAKAADITLTGDEIEFIRGEVESLAIA